jgi:hypothetical protein
VARDTGGSLVVTDCLLYADGGERMLFYNQHQLIYIDIKTRPQRLKHCSRTLRRRIHLTIRRTRTPSIFLTHRGCTSRCYKADTTRRPLALWTCHRISRPPPLPTLLYGSLARTSFSRLPQAPGPSLWPRYVSDWWRATRTWRRGTLSRHGSMEGRGSSWRSGRGGGRRCWLRQSPSCKVGLTRMRGLDDTQLSENIQGSG